MDKCEHDQYLGYDPTVAHPPMAAPYFTCTCCKQITFFIAHASWSYDMATGESHGHSESPSTELCVPCGGRTTVTDF